MSNSKFKKVKKLTAEQEQWKLLFKNQNTKWLSTDDENGGRNRDALEMFPEELWKMIWETMEEPKVGGTRLALMKSHPSLERVFEKEKSELLFFAVLPFLINYVKKDSSFNRKEITFALRLASKRCCSTIDKYLEDEWDYDDDDGRSSKLITLGKILSSKTFISLQTVIQFLEEVALHPEERNPLLSRTFKLTLEDGQWTMERVPPRPELLLEPLRKVGRFLKNLRLQFDSGDPPDFILFTHFGLLCTQMELQKLSLIITNARNVEERHFILGNDYLPTTLPKLKEMKLKGHGCVTMLKRCPIQIHFQQLTTLKIEFDLLKGVYLKNLLPNLEKFKLYSVQDGSYSRFLLTELISSINSPKLKWFGWEVVDHYWLGAIGRMGAKRMAYGMKWMGRFALLDNYRRTHVIKMNSKTHPEVENWICSVWFNLTLRKRAFQERWLHREVNQGWVGLHQ